MSVDTEEPSPTGAVEDHVWRPSSETAMKTTTTWEPPRSSGRLRRVLVRVGIAFALIAALVLVANLLDQPSGSDNEITAPLQPKADVPSARELRARYAGEYRDAEDNYLDLHKNGSWSHTSYFQTGDTGDLEWYVKENGNIFVTTYYSTDFAGREDISGMTFEPRKGGKVLVRLRDNGKPYAGANAERYVRAGK